MDNKISVSCARRMQAFVETLQDTICDALEELDGGARFKTDEWVRPEGGGGRTRVIEEGRVFEKGGVNTSAVFGDLPEPIARNFGVQETTFFATGLSLVVHPRSPFVPAVHANFRYFALGEDLEAPVDAWFGGGADLTPCYPMLEDTQHFHRVWKTVCDRHGVADYERFKEKCDAYFFLPHRQETRGVGGIFYDYMREDQEAAFAFSQDAGQSFLEAYVPLVHSNISKPYGTHERAYQALRRGRYVEFNLVYDRGTRFGLETNGRIESILMSLPPSVQWKYDVRYPAGSPEAKARWFFQPRDWITLDASEASL